MLPSEMDNGQSMLDVNIDTNLLSDFFDEDNHGVTSISDVDCGSAFDWADDFISSASTPLATDAVAERSPATTGSLPSTSPATSVPETQTITSTALPQMAQVVVTAQPGGVIQQTQIPVTIASQTILQKSANIIQGIAPGTQHFVVKTANGQQIQFQQPTQVQPAPGSSPAPAQQFSVPSPAISRSLTPSQSPAPSCSPHISRSITPNQSVVHQSVIANPSALSTSSSPNILHIASGQTQQSQVQLTNTVPIQSIIPNPSQNASIIPGQTVIPGHANNIVHTQNAVIQNPNVVNLNVATHVLCGNSQQVGQQAPGQIQNNIQGMPVSVQSPAGIQGSIQSNIQGNPVNLQGTIIQTAQGKQILIPNQQLGGHQINLNTMQPQVIQGQQIMPSGGTVIQNAMGVGNVIRLAAQPGQDKTASVVPPNISLVNIGGAQGQQILIQRAPHPAQGQPQNIIFKTLPQNLIQIQGSQAGQANLQGPSLQTASQISQQILHQASSQSVQYQQVLAASQPQPVKLVSQQGSQLTTQAGAVTLNLAGQNVNVVTGQNINLQQISGLGTAPVGSVQGIHLQQNGNQYIVQPAQTTQLSAQPQTVNMSSINQTSSAVTKASSVNQSTNIVSKALLSAGLGQVINTQIKPGQSQLEPKISSSGSDTATSKSKSKKSKSNDGQVKGSPQQLAQNVQKLQIPISQFIATASNAAGINTAQSTPTTVTTTVSQAVVQIPAQLTVASTLSGSQIVSSVQSKNTLGIMQTSTSPQIKIQPNIPKSGPPNVTLCPRVTTPTSAAEQQRLQKVQMEINKLLSQGNLSQDHLQKINLLKQNLKETYPTSVVPTVQSTPGTVSPKPIKPLVQTSVAGQPMVGQPPIAQPPVAITNQVPTIKTEPIMQPVSVQAVVSQPSIVVQPQPAGTGLIQLAVSQPATSGAATQVITSVAQAVQPQYLPKVLKQSPTKNIKVAPAGTTQVIQIQTAPVATSTPARPAMPAGTVIRTPPPGKVPISATPSLPTQIKIANQVLTLNLTSQQKDKLQEHLGRMSMEQQEMFLKQQQHVLLRLQQQQIQQQIQVIRQTSPQTKPQLLVANPPGTIPITVQQIDKGINQIKVGTEALQTNTANRAVKRPAPTDIPKGKLSIHQQLTKDQQHAVSPDTKSPFKDYKEACRRLLRFHVFQHHGPKEDAFKKAEASFDVVSDDLLKRSHTMMNKYRTLLLEESMRDKPSAEMVMIQRMLNQDLTSVIKKEKEVIKKTPECFVPMPVKYLKKEKEEDKEESGAETSAIDTSIVKSETFTESEYSDHDMSESFHHSSASADSEQIKSSPPVPPGKVKLVIRNDGRGFTSSLKAKTPVKTEPPSPLYGQITPEEPCVKVRVKEDPSFMDDFTSDQYADERDDLNMSGERADESGNILSGDLSSVGSDFNAADLQTGLCETSFRAQLGETRVSEPLGDVCELPAFHHTEEDSLLKDKDETSAAAVVAAASVASAVTDTVSQLNVHQPHYSDISITDVSGEYAGVLSPVHKPIDTEDAVLRDFTSQISQAYDPSAFDFPGELSSGNICSQSVVSPAARSETAHASLTSITIDNGFHHQMNIGGNHLHVTSSPTPASSGVYEPEDAAMSFTSSARPLSTVQDDNPEIDSAVHSIMDFEDVSSDGNITDISQEKGDLGAGALTSKDLPQNEMMFSPGPGDDDMDNDGLELDASFESDTNDPQNHMMNAQMQSAIDSILSLNQGDEQSDSFLDQSNMSGYYDNQVSEVTDTSQDESEYCADENGDDGDRPSGSGEGEDGEGGEGEGENDGDGETSMEDDLDAAVQSILM